MIKMTRRRKRTIKMTRRRKRMIRMERRRRRTARTVRRRKEEEAEVKTRKAEVVAETKKDAAMAAGNEIAPGHGEVATETRATVSPGSRQRIKKSGTGVKAEGKKRVGTAVVAAG